MVIPTQLVIPGMGACVSAYVSAEPAYVSAEPLEILSNGQGVLFPMSPVVARDDGARRPSPTQRGASGQAIFKGHVMARGLNLQESPDPGHAGEDCWVEGKLVQIKTTGTLKSDGSLCFHAGKAGGFARYTTIDVFAFVVINVPGLHARVRLMEASMVRGRWPGKTVHLHPGDFSSDVDLRLVEPVVTEQVFNELLAVRS